MNLKKKYIHINIIIVTVYTLTYSCTQGLMAFKISEL